MNKLMASALVAVLAIGVVIGYWISPESKAPLVSQTNEGKQPLFYRNPMNPAITSPVPAKDYMGMDYVPVYAEPETRGQSSPKIQVDPVVVQNMGVRTSRAVRGNLAREIRTIGRVTFDEQRMVRLHPKVEGWVEQMWVDKTGQSVRHDDILLSVFSPTLVATQQEYLLALNNFAELKESPFDEIRQGALDLMQSTRQRLELLDVAQHQIDELEQTRDIKKDLHIHSPASGTIIEIGARQGQYVTPKTELYRIVDLSQVWVVADVYEYELPWVREGDQVEMTLAAVPGHTFKGKLAYVYPYAETKTRTTKVRLIFDNRDRLLRPDMFAEVVIHADLQQDAIIVPVEAVIRSGENDQVLIVRAPGKFESRNVTLGVESNGQVAVLKGIQEGEQVVTSAQFLVDSESKLQEATRKMLELDVTPESEVPAEALPVMDHSEMDHSEMDHSEMDHSEMDHSEMDHSEMDHSEMEMPDGAQQPKRPHGVHQHD